MLPETTARLRFREMTEADLPQIATLEIGGTRGPQGWIEWTRRNYAEHEFGLWVVETHSGGFVGDCGLTMQEVEGEWLVEIGWHVRSSLRRQGYAAEAAWAVRNAAHDAGIQHLVAIIRPGNVASQRVAAKIGLVVQREVVKNGGPALVFGADLTCVPWPSVGRTPERAGAARPGRGGVTLRYPHDDTNDDVCSPRRWWES